MAKYKIKYSKLADKELLQILNYLTENWSIGIADNFEATFLKKIELLKENPKLGKISSKSHLIRSINITKHNKLYYQISKETIYLITIFDTRQDPAKNKFE
jgi:plasmid stabilization system protein ParE